MRDRLFCFACLAAAVLIVMAVASYAHAQPPTCGSGYCQRPPGRYAYSQPTRHAWRPVYQVAPAYSRPALVQAAAVVLASPTMLPPQPQAQPMQVGGVDAALAIINGARLARGLRPLPFDAGLAAYAATNRGVHQPGSSGGAAQCWAGVSDPATAARMWLASPPHLAILLSATTSIGIAPCPSGCTANAR